jgi:guanylate kinase
MPGKLIIFSAPSGSGKTTIVQYLLRTHPHLGFSISATTRPPRGEKEFHGRDYYFLSREEFERKISEDKFAEWEEVYNGTYYGTLKAEIERLWKEGKDVIFDVDVIGGLNLKKGYGEKALAIYVDIPDFDHLEQRLRQRATETEEKIRQRLEKAQHEREFRNQFDVILLNAKLEKALEDASKLVDDFLQ